MSGGIGKTELSTNETASGWQEVQFAAPVSIIAHTVYLASYYASNGHYAADNGYFANNYDNPPLHAPSSDIGAGNGVYKYGSGFPTASSSANNYWVDVIFVGN